MKHSYEHINLHLAVWFDSNFDEPVKTLWGV